MVSMGRGKHQITKDKKEISQLTKIAASTERAKRVLDRKDFWKDMPVFVRDKLGDMLSNVDPLEACAVIAVTPLVKVAIDASPKILEMYELLQAAGSPILGWLYFTYVKPKPEDMPKLDESMSWLISFGIAFLVVRNFGEILKAGQSIGGWVAKLFAVV